MKFEHSPNGLTQELLKTFREMVAKAIHGCIGEKTRRRPRLRNRIYKEFQEEYGLVTS